MSPLETLGFALGTSFASGLNLYATIAAAGLFQRFGIVELPPQLQVLAHPLVLGIAIALFLVEFVADKIPYVDTAWDGIHTFIRPPAAAFLSYTRVHRRGISRGMEAGGGAARRKRGAHLPRRQGQHPRGGERDAGAGVATGRSACWRTGCVVFLTWMAAQHPLLTACLVVVLVVVAVFVIWQLYGFLRAAVQLLQEEAQPSRHPDPVHPLPVPSRRAAEPSRTAISTCPPEPR